MALSSGDRLGAYEVLSLIGAGGMGEVYRARDTRLKRDVAIKVLPESFSHDPDRLARFQREAELLATLNHPNIGAVYGLEEGDGHNAIVLELVEGGTLADLIARGPLPIDDALPIATQIADALEAAHERGVVHRDLKPANINVAPDGHVKVLDFGLAKLLETSPAATGGLSMSPTLSVHATYAGTILGTAAYMSPEQARGKPVDRRTDIWAFGCVLFEMLTGKQVFATGETVSDAVAAILRSEPDWTALPADTPVAVRRLLRRCLMKDPRARLHDIADARLDIEEALAAPSGDAATTAVVGGLPRQNRWTRVLVAALVILVAVLAVPATRYVRQPAPEQLVTRLDVVVPSGVDGISLALSPDGRQLAFVAATETGPRLWLRALDETAARPLPGTDGASYPFWAADSRAVAFFADGKLKRTDLAGGAPQTIADAPAPRGGTWSHDGTIVFAPASAGGLMRVASTGGTPVQVTKDVAFQSRWPQFLPDGRRFLFFAFTGSQETRGVYLGSLDGGDPIRVTAADSAAVYAPPNRLLLVREGTLTALPFDPTRAVVTGDPVAVAQSVGSTIGYGRAMFAVSDTGVMTYRSGSGAQRRQLTWRDRAGRVLGTVGQPDDTDIPSMALAPDGRRIATTRTVQGNQDVWLIDVNRGVPSRLTFNASADSGPGWSADGQRVVFRSARTGAYDLFEKPASGAGDEQLLLATPGTKTAYDSSADGRFLLYGALGTKTGADIWALPLTGDRKPFPVVQTSFSEDSAQFSADGHWIAYESNESGQFEIYVQAFPGVRGKWQVSTGGGIHPRWSPGGKELFYVAPDGRLMAAPVIVGSSGQSIEAGTPVALFTPRLASGGAILSPGSLARPLYAVAADGRFLVNEAIEDAVATPLTVILNWDAALSK